VRLSGKGASRRDVRPWTTFGGNHALLAC